MAFAPAKSLLSFPSPVRSGPGLPRVKPLSLENLVLFLERFELLEVPLDLDLISLVPEPGDDGMELYRLGSFRFLSNHHASLCFPPPPLWDFDLDFESDFNLDFD